MPPGETVIKRFWDKVDTTGECWLWTGAEAGLGYGSFTPKLQTVYAHRWAYETLIGPIPSDMTLDHLCRARRCVRPLHLDLVSNRDNILRGTGASARNARKIQCAYGHPFDLFNTRYPARGGRACRTCEQRYSLTAKARQHVREVSCAE